MNRNRGQEERGGGGGWGSKGTHQLLDAIAKRDGRQDEARSRHPQVSQDAIQQPPSSLDGGLESDAGAKLAGQRSPGSLDVGEPQNHVGNVGKPQRLGMPPLQRGQTQGQRVLYLHHILICLTCDVCEFVSFWV